MVVKPNSIFTKPLLLIAYIAVAGFSTSASAHFVTWSFDDLAFNDGGMGSGSFDFDESTNTFDNVNVVTTNGTTGSFLGKTYTAASFFGASLTSIDFTNTTAGELLSFVLDDAMTDAGGTLLARAVEGTSNHAIVRHTIIGEEFEISAVPIPAAVWLFGSGLLGLIGVARRKTRA